MCSDGEQATMLNVNLTAGNQALDRMLEVTENPGTASSSWRLPATVCWKRPGATT